MARGADGSGSLAGEQVDSGTRAADVARRWTAQPVGWHAQANNHRAAFGRDPLPDGRAWRDALV